jgi:hypothetical protein
VGPHTAPGDWRAQGETFERPVLDRESGSRSPDSRTRFPAAPSDPPGPAEDRVEGGPALPSASARMIHRRAPPNDARSHDVVQGDTARLGQWSTSLRPAIRRSASY